MLIRVSLVRAQVGEPDSKRKSHFSKWLFCFNALCIFSGQTVHHIRSMILVSLLPLLCSGCAVVAVAGAAATVVSTTVSVGATVIGSTVDIAAAGVHAVVGSDDEKE